MELDLIREDPEVGAVRLRVGGALDLSSKAALYAAGLQALDTSPGLVLNLAAVGFLDSSGLGVIIELAREAEERGKSFAVEEPSARVARILSVTGLQDAWT